MANTAITTGGGASISPRRAPRREDGTLLGYAMLAPAALLVGILILLPLAYSVVLSLYDWKLLEMNRPKRWSGLGNYWKLLTDDGLHNAFVNTVIFMVGSVTVELVLGFIIALAVFHMTQGRRLANAIILLPMVITPVVTALLWRYMLDPQFGIVAQVMTALGSKGGIDVWGSSTLALPGLMLVDIWQWTPFAILILHAGMLGISEEQFEAAAVDGAGHLRVAFSIILPAIVPQVLVVLLFRSMDTYRIFDTVFVLTRGGPGISTDTLGLFTFRNGFSYLQMGYAMALSVFLLATVSVISAFYIRLLRRRGML